MLSLSDLVTGKLSQDRSCPKLPIAYQFSHHAIYESAPAAPGKFVSGAKVLAAVPSMSQPKDFTSLHLTLADRERVFNKHRNTEIERVFSGMVNRTLSH